jgi:hypothetical protein
MSKTLKSKIKKPSRKKQRNNGSPITIAIAITITITTTVNDKNTTAIYLRKSKV